MQTSNLAQKEDIVSRAASVARIAVSLEMAYDVVDELARMPERYPELFARLSRLISKVLRDVEKALESNKLDEKSQKALEAARSRLLQWSEVLKELFSELESKEEAARNNLIKKFAALAVAPDRLSNKLRKILNR